jgi:vacuolar-type H+-ATPase subunit E/Vma4
MSVGDMESLVEAVKSEVERDRERILNHAQSEARSIIARAQADAAAESKKLIQEAEKKANQLLVEVQATARLEAQASKLEKREAILDKVFELAAQKLNTIHQVDDYKQAVYELIEDAVVRLEDVETLVVDADVATLGFIDQDELTKLGQNNNCRLILGSEITEGTGVIVHSPDGHLVYDNTFQARLARLKPTLRSPVFQILKGQNT